MSSTLFSCGVKRTLKVADIPGTTLLPASSGPTTRKYSESCSSSFTCRGTLAKKNITKTPWNKKTWGRYTCKWWFIHHYLCLVLIVVIILLQSSMTNHSALLKHNPGPMTHPNPQYVVNAFFFLLLTSKLSNRWTASIVPFHSFFWWKHLLSNHGAHGNVYLFITHSHTVSLLRRCSGNL